jgi:DnaJ homolog subfamily B member 4
MGLDYYKVLGIDKSASEDDIKKAYKKMVREQVHVASSFI